VLAVELEAFSDEVFVTGGGVIGGGITVELEVELDVFNSVPLDVLFVTGGGVIGGGMTVELEVELVLLAAWQLAHLI